VSETPLEGRDASEGVEAEEAIRVSRDTDRVKGSVILVEDIVRVNKPGIEDRAGVS